VAAACSFHPARGGSFPHTGVSVDELILLALLTFIAAGVGTLTGFGTSTLMVPVLTLFFPLSVTLLFVGIIHFFGDVWKMALFRGGLEWNLILGFGIPGIVASYFGATLTVAAPEELLQRLLGGFLLAYVVFLFLHQDWKLPDHTGMAVAGGTLSGFSAGIFGVGGAIRSTFLSAFDLPKSVYIFTSGAIAFIIDAVRITTYLWEGTRLEPLLLYGMALFIPVSLLGAWVAKKLVGRIPQDAFRLVIAAFLGAVAIRYLFLPDL
jgi:uncharacterized protein